MKKLLISYLAVILPHSTGPTLNNVIGFRRKGAKSWIFGKLLEEYRTTNKWPYFGSYIKL